ncbi:hypothetical protein GCM10011511_30810 [Puia dinghuensis]|uniref:Pyrrolo-quinoline quinone repeat domain-containing protein n=2 Tax=Puia dinghuensis TaxID=1792502 RepID=A0A8J2XTQ0_9BACT|nr:hypothetical protein GCM10011511_30810 [Puia dinghuensis]
MLACHKDHPAPVPPPPSSEKDITLFELKKADNPTVLTADVIGVFVNDTIQLNLPAQTPVTSLVPFITIIGKSVAPAAGSPQDFTSGVTYTVTADDGSTKTFKVVVNHKSALYVTDGTGKLTCLDPITSGVNWTYQCGTTSLSCPTAGNGMVFTTGYDGLYAVNANNGSLAWKMSFTALRDTFNIKSPGPAFPVPIFVNGTIYGSFADGTVRAVDAKTGTVKWSFTTNFPFHSGPTLYNSSLYVGGVDGYLYSIDANTGAQNWRFKGSGDPFIENPLVLNNIVYIGSQGAYFYAVQANSGNLVWDNTDYLANASPAAGNGIIYTAPENLIIATDPLTGTQKWYVDHDTVGPDYNGMSSPYVANGKVFVGSINGHVYAHDATNGHSLWSYNVGYYIFSSPVVANGRLYITDMYGHVIVLNTADGSSVWTSNVGQFASSICLIDSSGTTYHPAESGEQN